MGSLILPLDNLCDPGKSGSKREDCDAYWESYVSRGMYLVRARRRLIQQPTASTLEKKFSLLSRRTPQGPDAHSNENDHSEDSEDDVDGASDSEQD